MRAAHNHIIEQVPPDYYQNGIKTNIFQRFWHVHKLQTIKQLIDSQHLHPKRILDVGCASGWFLSRLQTTYPKSSCYGVDIYDKGILYGKKKYSKLKLSVNDAHKLPFKRGYFDLIVCTEVLEHVEQPGLVLKEIKRVLSKNGIAIIELDSGSILFSIVWYLWRKWKGRVWNEAHLHSFTLKKLRKQAKQSEFHVIAEKTFNMGMAIALVIGK